LAEVCKSADVVVAAVGKAGLVKPEWIKPGAVVIDCGINPIKDETKKSGQRLELSKWPEKTKFWEISKKFPRKQA